MTNLIYQDKINRQFCGKLIHHFPMINVCWELCQYLVLVSEGVLPSFFEL